MAKPPEIRLIQPRMDVVILTRPGHIAGVDLHVIHSGQQRELLKHAIEQLQHCLWSMRWQGPTRVTFEQFAQCVALSYDVRNGDPRVRQLHQALVSLHEGLALAVRTGLPFEVSVADLPSWHDKYAPMAAYGEGSELEAAA